MTQDIYIFDELTQTDAGNIISDLVKLDLNNVTNINIYMCCCGGDLYGCFAILTYITEIRKKYGIHVTTYGMGQVASAGFFLFLLGDTRILYPMTRVFVHEHINYEEQEMTHSERKVAGKEDDIVHRMYVDFISERLNMPNKDIVELLQKNKNLSDSEIKNYNVTTQEL